MKKKEKKYRPSSAGKRSGDGQEKYLRMVFGMDPGRLYDPWCIWMDRHGTWDF